MVKGQIYKGDIIVVNMCVLSVNKYIKYTKNTNRNGVIEK